MTVGRTGRRKRVTQLTVVHTTGETDREWINGLEVPTNKEMGESDREFMNGVTEVPTKGKILEPSREHLYINRLIEPETKGEMGESGW